MKNLQSPLDICPSTACGTALLHVETLNNADDDGDDELKQYKSWTLTADEITVMKD